MGFDNNEHFALAARIMREKVLKVPQANFASQGGPNPTYLSQIETGKLKTITPEIIENYRTAISYFAEPDYPPPAPSASPSAAAVSFFDALVTACMPDSAFGRTAFGDTYYGYTDGEAEPDTGILIGEDLITNKPIYASALQASRGHHPDTDNWPPPHPTAEIQIDFFARQFTAELRAETEKEQLFRQSIGELIEQECATAHVALAIAQLNAITVVTGDDTGICATASWSQLVPTRTVYTLSELQLDPLTGIRSLQDATSRARTMVGAASETDIDAVGWIILLSNALAEWLDEPGPLAAWRRYHLSSERWVSLCGQLDPKVQADLPGVDHLLMAAEPYLSPWSQAYGAPRWNVSFGPKEKQTSPSISTSMPSPNVTFTATEVTREPAPTLKLGDLIRYTPMPNLQVPQTLAAMGYEVIELNDTSIRKVSATNSGQPETIAAPAYQWCPTPHADRILVRKVGSDTWRAARPTPVLRGPQQIDSDQ